MSARADEWGRLGRGLRAHAPEGASLVYGAVGAVGYFSGLFIYDTNGLVTREVALLEVLRRRLLRCFWRAEGIREPFSPPFGHAQVPTSSTMTPTTLMRMPSRPIACSFSSCRNR